MERHCQTCKKVLSRRQAKFCSRTCYWINKPKLSESHKRNISEGNRGRVVSSETRKLIGSANAFVLRGRKLSAIHRQHISENTFLRKIDRKDPTMIEKARFGRMNSEKWKAAQSSKQKREKQSASLKGRKFSLSHRMKLSRIAKKRIQEGYGFPHGISKTEAVFGDKVYEKFGVLLQPSFWLEGRCFDYRVPEQKTLIECDGKYWHRNLTVDKLKNQIAKNHGFNLIRLEISQVSDVNKVIQENEDLFRKLFGYNEQQQQQKDNS